MSNLPTYIILQINVTNAEAYQKYAMADQVALLARFGGRLVVIDGEPTVLEGAWPFNRTVVMEFPDREHAVAWYESPEYQRMLSLRHAAATSNCIITGGLPDVFRQKT